MEAAGNRQERRDALPRPQDPAGSWPGFRGEARALIEFQGRPSIVSCREFFRANGTAYLVMEYEDGLPLSELLRRREASGRPFDEADLPAVMVPLLEGLQRVHEAGMLYRDIKPSIRQKHWAGSRAAAPSAVQRSGHCAGAFAAARMRATCCSAGAASIGWFSRLRACATSQRV